MSGKTKETCDDLSRDVKTELYGREWRVTQAGDLVLYLPDETLAVEAESQLAAQREGMIEAANDVALLNEVSGLGQTVIFFPPDLYEERFLEKAVRMGFDPEPWVSWSEGDIDTIESIGKVFCVRIGVGFLSHGDMMRFFAHELTHPITFRQTPLLHGLLADAEGIAEADARLGLSLQRREDMGFSSDFIVNLSTTDLVPITQVNNVGYDHPRFVPRTVSQNPGYAICFLWFAGQALRLSSLASGTIEDRYRDGRKRIFTIASAAGSTDEYKQQLHEAGFDYDLEASQLDLLLWTQNELRKALF